MRSRTLVREHLTLLRTPGRVADPRRVVPDDQHRDVPVPLERGQPPEHDREADVDVRPRGVDAELHAERPAEGELRLESALGEDVDGVPGQVRDAHAGTGPVTCAAVTSSGERQPRRASAFSVSSRRISSTCRTPFSPPSASP